MRKEEMALLVTLLVGAALIGARSATAQGSLADAAPSLELRALWQAPAASLFFGREMPR
jgi:hypothetical protein